MMSVNTTHTYHYAINWFSDQIQQQFAESSLPTHSQRHTHTHTYGNHYSLTGTPSSPAKPFKTPTSSPPALTSSPPVPPPLYYPPPSLPQPLTLQRPDSCTRPRSCWGCILPCRRPWLARTTSRPRPWR